jgi:beta-glucanase (GH16 family)
MHLSRLLPAPLLFLALISTQALTGSPYRLVWSDEFDYEGLPDPEKWGYDVGGWGWGNIELQYYTEARAKNARVEGGNLVIEAHHEPAYEGNNNDYTSARLLTKDKHEWMHGRIEARIKVPDGLAGLWPAFWMLGNDFETVGWPFCGEIDIMEYVSKWPNQVMGTIHGPGYNGGASFGGDLPLEEPVANNFHLFAIEWEPELIRWSVDGILYHTAVPEDIYGTGRTPKPWVFEHPFFIILNLAIGGTFGGELDPGLTFPVQMLVDYVRVYEADFGIFNSYPRARFWADSGDFLGRAYLASYPWVYLESLSSYTYTGPSEETGGWFYIPK